MTSTLTIIVAMVMLTAFPISVWGLGNSPFMWMNRIDNYDPTRAKMTKLRNEGGCRSKHKDDLMLPRSSVTQIPQFNTLKSKVWYPNRTALVHLHNMALNRAMFYSFIFQKMNASSDYKYQPNWLYMYMDVNANVKANLLRINGSAIVFDKYTCYANWYQNKKFNTTLRYFGAKAWDWDDFRDTGNNAREPTQRTAVVVDLGADGANSDYTHPNYKMNNWYGQWLPDKKQKEDSVNKFTYSVGIRYSKKTGKFVSDTYETTLFFGPSNPGQGDNSKRLPVQFTQPYFDCGKRNNWVISATSPVVDYMPRYSNYTHLRRPRFVAVISMDMDFDQIDFNACPVSTGNPGPSYLAGIDRCKKKTTTCKQDLHYDRGFGLGRYNCECKPGYRYPKNEKPPFRGDIIEEATEKEYADGFDCIKVQDRQVLPAEIEGDALDYNDLQTLYEMDSNDIRRFKKKIAKRSAKIARSNSTLKSLHMKPLGKSHGEGGHLNVSKRRHRRETGYEPKAFDRMIRIFNQYSRVTKKTCKNRQSNDLVMPGDVTYGVESQFEFEARTALRLSHFLSNFLQSVDGSEKYGNLKGGGHLGIDHMFGEVIANVMANHRILSSGIYFDDNAYVYKDGSTRELFGPLAFSKDGKYYAIDTAGLKYKYTQEDWFISLKQRWKTNTVPLKKYVMKPKVRSTVKGGTNVKFEFYPIKYYAPSVEDGEWFRPIFRCDGRVDNWVMMYAVPFFGKEGSKKVAFKGLITVDVPLNALKINQCPMPYHVPNAFKNTAKCHHQSTTCRPLDEFPWSRGAYRCDCKQGHEYYFMDGKSWFEGSLLEVEWLKKQYGLFSRFDSLYCRVSRAPIAKCSYMTIILAVILTLNELDAKRIWID